jgi:hypothetical protein
MQTHKIFARIWRINAIIILLVGLIAGLVLSVVGYMLLKDTMRNRQVNDVANITLGEVQRSAALLGSFEEIPGSTVLRAPLTVKQTYALGSSSKDAGSTRNYLYFDPATRSASWLLPSMDSVVLSSIALPSSEYGGNKKDVAVFVHVSVSADTDNDGRLTASDTKQIAISSPNGKNYRVLVSKVDKMNEAMIMPSGRLLILYSIGAQLNAMELTFRDLSLPPIEYEVPTALKQ